MTKSVYIYIIQKYRKIICLCRYNDGDHNATESTLQPHVDLVTTHDARKIDGGTGIQICTIYLYNFLINNILSLEYNK